MKTVVIGGGSAGTGAAGGVKAASPDNEVVVYTDFQDIAYSPCGIPFVHGKEIESFSKLFLATKEDYVKAGIDIHYETTVTSIDVKAKTIEVEGEGTVSWDRLVIASGFKYADPGVPGGDLDGLYYMKNIREAEIWDKRLDTVKKAVVIEAGPLGAEMVSALAHRGIETHVVDPHPWALSEIADPDIVAPVEQAWRDQGVHLHFNTKLEAFLGPSGSVTGVRTSEGDIDCDMVVVATHKTPDTKLATAAGLKIGSTGGIIVGGDMSTSAPGVWAAGDCIEAVLGQTKIPIQGLTGSHAYSQGKVAGFNAGGGAGGKVYSPVYVPWGMLAATEMVGGVALGETLAASLGHPAHHGCRARNLAGELLPRRTPREDQTARRSRNPQAHRRADGRRRRHQGARRLPRDVCSQGHHTRGSGHDGERLLAGHRRPQRTDLGGRPERPSRTQEVTRMSFSGWLRSNSQHYLVAAAQQDIAKKHGVPGPVRYGGISEFFWLRIFAPLYQILPWKLRHAIMRGMPGSHRRHWDYPTDTTGPAI